jgi:hypothetical protein
MGWDHGFCSGCGKTTLLEVRDSKDDLGPGVVLVCTGCGTTVTWISEATLQERFRDAAQEFRGFFGSLTWGDLQPLLERALHDPGVAPKTLHCPAVAELAEIAFTAAIRDAFDHPGTVMTEAARRRADQAVAVMALLEGLLVLVEQWLEHREPGKAPSGPQGMFPGFSRENLPVLRREALEAPHGAPSGSA